MPTPTPIAISVHIGPIPIRNLNVSNANATPNITSTKAVNSEPSLSTIGNPFLETVVPFYALAFSRTRSESSSSHSFENPAAEYCL